MVTADMGEVVLEMGEDLGECHDGVLLGRMRRSKVNGLSGGLGAMDESWGHEEWAGRPTMMKVCLFKLYNLY